MTPIMSKPRLLLWHWGRRGGGPRYTIELARALAAMETVDLHLSWSRQAEIAHEFAALRLPGLPVDTYENLRQAAARSLTLPLLRRRFARYVAERRIDVVLCSMDHLWNVAITSAIAGTGARYVLALHDALAHPGEENHLRAWTLRRQLAQTDGVLALSQHVRSQLLSFHGYPADRVWLLPHGAPQYGAPAVRAHPGERPFRLLFFGRYLPYKGIDILLDAYALLRARYGERVTLRMAGSGDLGPYAERLANLAGVDMENRWFAEEEIAPELAAADAVILPYREASQSGVAPSAAAVGLPAVVTPVGGLTEQVIDGVSGLIAAAATAQAVADGVAAMIDDPALYHRLSQGALDHAAAALSWRPIAEGVVKLIHEIAALAPRIAAKA